MEATLLGAAAGLARQPMQSRPLPHLSDHLAYTGQGLLEIRLFSAFSVSANGWVHTKHEDALSPWPFLAMSDWKRLLCPSILLRPGVIRP